MDTSALLLLASLLGALGLTLILRRRRRRKIKRRYWVRPWLRRRNDQQHRSIVDFHKELIFDGDIQEFRATLRMGPDTYHNLLEVLTPALTRKYSNFRIPIPPDARLALTLRYMALGECFRTLSQIFRIGLSTTRLIVRQTCIAINEVLRDKYIVTPQSSQDWIQIATAFNQRWQFPHCIGCVDGKHVRIIAPRNTGSYYHNYKDFFSVVLMAVANADYDLIYVDIGSEGKAADGGIWAQSSFNQYLQHPNNPLDIPPPDRIVGINENIPYFLIGDDAFRLGPNMLKPYPGYGLTKKQEIFNYRLSRCRRIIENVFGIITCRFKMYRRSIEVSPDFVSDLVMSSCVMHNYLRKHASMQYIPTNSVDQELPDGNLVPGAWRQELNVTDPISRNTQKNASTYAKKIRNLISDYFLTDEGEVEWQYNSALL